MLQLSTLSRVSIVAQKAELSVSFAHSRHNQVKMCCVVSCLYVHGQLVNRFLCARGTASMQSDE